MTDKLKRYRQSYAGNDYKGMAEDVPSVGRWFAGEFYYLASDVDALLASAPQGSELTEEARKALENSAAFLGQLVENPIGAYSPTRCANLARDCIAALSSPTAPRVWTAETIKNAPEGFYRAARLSAPPAPDAVWEALENAEAALKSASWFIHRKHGLTNPAREAAIDGCRAALATRGAPTAVGALTEGEQAALELADFHKHSRAMPGSSYREMELAMGVMAACVRRLLSIPSNGTEESNYDKAVKAMAPYLPEENGVAWIAQSKDGFTEAFDDEPVIWNEQWSAQDHKTNSWRIGRMLNIPACPDWRTSLRRIESGRVVPIPQPPQADSDRKGA